MTANDRANEFIDAFNEIDNGLRALTKLTDRSRHTFVNVVDVAAEGNAYIRRHQADLRGYAELRNAIVHGPQEKVIAEPLQLTVDSIRRIADDTLRPPSATR